MTASSARRRIVPPVPTQRPEDEESLDVWGFKDSGFRVDERGAVAMAGRRYPLCGYEMRDLVPWMERTIGACLDATKPLPSHYPPPVPPPHLDEAFLASLTGILAPEQISTDERVRLRHGHGHTQHEMWAVKNGGLARVPDVVLHPTAEDQVLAIVEGARRHGVCLIPYGGGTSVSQALLCPTDEHRPIASIDMRRMNRVLWIDPVNRMACIEAGALGRDIERTLADHGFTMGHDPDSIEFSTLGGWIATHASGMKRNRYGNIEDLVLDMRVVSVDGVLERTAVTPRESSGLDPRKWMYGSEGALGIVTSATVKLFDLPEVQRYDCIVFPTFEDGVAFLRDLSEQTSLPASVRLVDNLQLQFSMALKPPAEGLAVLKSRLEKAFLKTVKRMDPERMAAVTLVFEGTRDEVAAQERATFRIAGRHRGMRGGEENGRRGYLLTFGIAYIRDFIMRLGILGESFETSVAWGDIAALYDGVRARVLRECEQRGVPGRPFITARITQVYPSGVCMYFYFGFYYVGLADPSATHAAVEHAAREEIMRHGGSLSHHHGVGKLRAGFLSDIQSPASLTWIRQLKAALDPDNVFGCANQGLPAGSPRVNEPR